MASIEDAIESFRKGIPIIVMDDEDRENEGDIILPAQDTTEEIIAILVNETTGILCAPMTEEWADRIGLYPMIALNTDPKGTAFTVTTDLKPVVPLDSGLIPDICNENGESGLTTGVSAEDRVMTFRALAHPGARGSDFGRPGHIFPLRAKRGGVPERRGHTEASVDLCRLAGKRPVACIGELVKKDGSMRRLDDCKRLGWKLGYPCITIDALANYLYRKPLAKLPSRVDVVKVAECEIPVTRQGKFLGKWKMVCFKEAGNHEHIVMVLGDVASNDDILVRIHSECFTGDLLRSMRCDCGEQLDASFASIAEKGCGVIIYMTGHEGRGIGLVNKMHAYELQAKRGFDTYRANRELGFEDDTRNFDACAHIIKQLGMYDKTIKLLTNCPPKCNAISDSGLKVVPQPLLCEHNEYNSKYLADKRSREARQREGGLASRPQNIIASLRLSDREHLSLIPKLRVVIVRTVWFGIPLRSLEKQVIQFLEDTGLQSDNIGVVTVPSAEHLPYAAKTVAETGKADAILCLGITIKGGHSPHAFACMSSAVAEGITMVQIQQGTPVLYGVLSCDHKQQVIDRCSVGSELSYSLALSTVKVATEQRRVVVPKGGDIPAFPSTNSNTCSSPIAVTMRQSCAANNTQAEELSNNVQLPSKEVANTLKIAIIATVRNQTMVDSMTTELIDRLVDHYILKENITVTRVPGSFEIPYAASIAAKSGVDVVVTCGVLVKDDSAHFEYVAYAEALGSVDIQLEHLCPILSGVVLCSDESQLASRVSDTPLPLALSVLHQAALSRELKQKKSSSKPPFSFGNNPNPLTEGTDSERSSLKVGILRTAWNENMVVSMRDGVKDYLTSVGIKADNIYERVVPGSYELPSAAQLLANSTDVDVIVCLGILIKGDTKHFEYICQATSHGILRSQQQSEQSVPMLFGVLTCFSVEQSKERACSKDDNVRLAKAAIHMGLLKREAYGVSKGKKSAIEVSSKTVTPSSLRPALLGELVKDIPRTLEAPSKEEAAKTSVAIVATCDEEPELVEQMVAGISEVFELAGLASTSVAVQYVHNSFDLSIACSNIIKTTDVAAVLAVGVLIEDNTAKFDTACEASSFGLREVSIQHEVPVLFGVLTCNTREQAKSRAEAGSELHYSLAMSTLHMALMRRRISQRSGGQKLRLKALDTTDVIPGASSLKVCLIRTSWNEEQLLGSLENIRSKLMDAGIRVGNIMEEVVPGTFDLPFAAKQIADSTDVDVICVIGSMVKGDTLNFEYMASATIRGFASIAKSRSVPMVWGVECVMKHNDVKIDPDQITSRILSAARLPKRLLGQ
eukprot:TRINITY_DN17797_c0_g1_i1.p1 TRINITY_DN17797_c0_g1~~TRINITY_DN17797_c0_g1_i1.p1  ORF type:complete len:1358 (+),score=316.64 TRINITY_DN17797_c0_g1_i1:141-4076(+)